jgi:DNA polymerase-3 subunit beta
MLKTEKTALLSALNAVIGAVKANHANPIMSDFLIEQDGDGILVTGGNLSIEIRSRCEAKVEEDFQDFTCPAHRLLEIVKNAPEAQINIDLIDNGLQVQIRSGRSRLKLPAMPGSDYPKLNAGSANHTIGLSAELLAKAIKGVAFATETSPSRPYLCGVHLRPVDEGMDVVGTDGRIVAKRTIQSIAFDQDIASLPAITIPNESIKTIDALLSGGDDVELMISKQMVTLSVGSTVLLTKLVEGNYPEYRRIKPADDAILAKFSAAALEGAVNRVLIATPDAAYGISFNFTKDTLSLSARDMKAGEGEDEVPIEATGEIVSGFNGKFIDSALAHLDGDKAELLVGKDAAPALLRCQGDEHNYFILMPTRVRAG